VLRCKTERGVRKRSRNWRLRGHAGSGAAAGGPGRASQLRRRPEVGAAPRPGDALPDLLVNPRRPDRAEPRCKKRRPKQYDLMNKPRDQLRRRLKKQRKSA